MSGYYPNGCSASDYEAWAGTECDGEPTCDNCGAELDDNGDCTDCDFDEEEEEESEEEL